jgi:hypothetical protein
MISPGRRMERGIVAPLSPNEGGTLCRIATALAPRAMLRARDAERLQRLLLVRDVDGRLELTATGRERHRQLSGAIAPGTLLEEIDVAVVNFFSERR